MRYDYNLHNFVLNQNNIVTSFCVIDCIGEGGSCIAYHVTYEEADGIKHTGILKEYCPAYLEKYGEVRNRDGSLRIVPEIAAQFSAELDKFRRVYVSINDYLVNNPEAANFHPVQLGIYEGNNTLYTLASCDYGKSYDKIKDESLKSALNLMLSVTKGVELYHNAGFLHLDIKPENIFILNGVTELIKLFDYDSLTPIEDLKARKIKAVPCPGVYYVPELNQRNFRAIDKSTDIFEIGAMLFLRLTGRSPEPQDIAYDSVYNFENAALLKNVSPKVIFELEELFRHTLQTSPVKRYQTTVQLKRQLEKLISLVDSKRPYLLNMPKWQPAAEYVGRKQEVSEIHRRLQSDGYVFVKGIGGLGKSELAKIYAKEYADYYHTVVFCKYTDSLTGLVASLPIQGINTDDYNDFDRLVSDKNQVLHDCDEHTLIIVDNFNVTYDKFLRDFLPAGNDGFKVIFTTRCTQASEYYASKTYDLPKLSLEDCERLFQYRADIPATVSDKAVLQQIIGTVDRNTLILVLLASAVKRTHMTLAEALYKLDNQELDAIRPELFHEYDYDTEDTQAYNKLLSHLYAVFSISGLSSEETEVLKDMTLIPLEGIEISALVEFCKSPVVTRKAIERLADQSWLFFSDGQLVSMHPTVSDLIANNNKIQKQHSYLNLAEALEDYCNPDYLSHISVIMSRISTAVQLERRYKTETLDKRILIKSKLGRLYANIYRPAQARKYLTESEKLAIGTEYEYFLPYIYNFLGETEKNFGTLTTAIQYYRESIRFGKKPMIRYYEIVAESMIAIGNCYLDNKQYDDAYMQLREALRFVRLHKFSDKIADIALSMIEICRELDMSSKERKYRELYEQNKKVGGYDDSEYQIFDHIEESAKAGNFDEMLQVYNEFLEQKREELGEDSPIYKDIAQGKWLNYLFSGDKESAIRAVTEDLAFVAESFGEDSMEMAARLIAIAGTFPYFNEFDYAENTAKRAIRICERLKEESSYIHFQARLALAQCYIPQNRLTEAKQAISGIDLRAFRGNEVLSDIISSAGFVFCELSMSEEIEPLCIEFLEYNNTDTVGQIAANIILSIVNEHRGELEAAENYAQNAKHIIDGIKDRNAAKQFFMHYYRAAARLASRRGDNIKAIATLREFLSFYTQEEQLYFAFHVVFNELGLYYAYSGDTESAEKSYLQAERILDHNHMPKESYIVLYNNSAHQLMTISKFQEAKKYLDKIVEVQPDVVRPKTFLDAVICGNIAWASFNLSNTDYAIEVSQASLNCYKKIGSENTREFATGTYNLALMYVNKEQYRDAVQLLKSFIDRSDKNPELCEMQIRIWADKYYVFSLLKLDCGKEAYAYAEREVTYFSGVFEEGDIRYADFLTEIGLAFISAQYEDCAQFYQMALDCLKTGGHEKTLSYAKLMNNIGVYLIDLQDDHNEALRYFIESKAVFEEIHAENNELYPVVLQNIDYANNVKMKKINEIIAGMAQTMKDELDNE